MPEIIDAFEGTFNNTFLAQQIENVPFRPSLIGRMLSGSIQAEFPPSSSIQVDLTEGRIGVLETKPRDADPQTIGPKPLASSIAISAVHIPARATIYAEQINGKRRPGETQMKTIARTVNDRLADMNRDFDLTFEMHRIGMLKGKVLDKDGSELFNYFNLLGKSQKEVDFPLSTNGTDVNSKTRTVQDAVDDALGGLPYDSIAVVAGRNWYDAFVSHSKVRDTFANHEAARTLREDPSNAPFSFGSFDDMQRYRDSAASTLPDSVGPDEAYAIPLGVPNMFRVYWTPQGTFDTVNDRGQRLLVTRKIDRDHGEWVEMKGRSNPIWLNTYPDAVIRLTKS